MSNTTRAYCGPPLLRFNVPRSKGKDAMSWFGSSNVYFCYRARTAIRFVCDVLKLNDGGEILVPSYNCGSEIDPLFKGQARVKVYRVDTHARVSMSDLLSRINNRTKAIYVTHYFGFPQSIVELKKICESRDIYLIEDCALSLFSCLGDRKLGSFGDLAVFSFPKTLAVPDGGALLVNNTEALHVSWRLTKPNYGQVLVNLMPHIKHIILSKVVEMSHLYNLLGRALKRRKRSVAKFGQTEQWPGMPHRYYFTSRLQNVGMSMLTRYALTSTDYTMIVENRRKNFKQLLQMVNEIPSVEPLYSQLPEGVCPLSFPLVIKNRDRKTICARLRQASIDAIAWWSGYHPRLPWRKFPDACFLKDNIITLPIHQDLKAPQIRFIGDCLLKAITH